MSNENSEVLFERLIFDNPEKGNQIRIVLNLFRDIEYLHIRKYYQDYEDTWHPTKDGISMPATLSNIYALLDALVELCSKTESIDSILKHFETKLAELTNERENIRISKSGS